MKFAKDLDEDLIPEWRTKYFDYRQGKKRIKAIVRAYKSAARPIRTPSFRNQPSSNTSGARKFLTSSPFRESPLHRTPPRNIRKSPVQAGVTPTTSEGKSTQNRIAVTPVLPGNATQCEESHASTVVHTPHSVEAQSRQAFAQPVVSSVPSSLPPRPTSLRLPEPALGPSDHQTDGVHQSSQITRRASEPHEIPRGDTENAYEIGKTKTGSSSSHRLIRRHTNALKAQYATAMRRERERPFLKRLFSRGSSMHGSPVGDIPLDMVEAIDKREKELWLFCERELDKIERFYKAREDEAGEVLESIKEQLQTLRDQHIKEKDAELEAKAQHKKERIKLEKRYQNLMHPEETPKSDGVDNEHVPATSNGNNPFLHPVRAAKQVSFRSDSDEGPLTPPKARDRTKSRDYERNPHEISYRHAKRKLKAALFEFYRSLDLLKSYCMLNEKAFRKLNKKYDKLVHARLPMWFVSERVTGAYFVRSHVLDSYFSTVEDLYARYFEKGNHKVAVGKLRARPPTRYHGWTILTNGVLFTAGFVLGIQGLVQGFEVLSSSDAELHLRTSYLLQLYAGYFLMLLLFLYFCIDCFVFTQARVNYVFIFEFDTRHNLDWRELFEIPCLFFLFLGLTIFLNFTLVAYTSLYVYWPVILVGVTLILIINPFPIMYHHSRFWLLESCWRLLGAGFYKVNFRDFFLGDMFCSLAYSLGNIELFFCLYAHHWDNPGQCNSTHSRLLGFFTTVPGIIRAGQCVRRYIDTRDAFPHLANCAKYFCTILYYLSLSVYRINQNNANFAFFLTFALINSLYTSFWDIIYDWSIGDFAAPSIGLRKTLAYKWHWSYYIAAVIDPILRFNWIFYAIYTPDLQHSSLVSFMVGLSEVTRRGMWSIFRVENEHCTNVGRFRATPEIKLPYPTIKGRLGAAHSEDYQVNADGAIGDDAVSVNEDAEPSMISPSRQAVASGADLERATSRESAIQSMRRRQAQLGGRIRSATANSTRARVGTLLHGAHAQDFERQKKSDDHTGDEDDEDDDIDDDDEEYHKALEEAEMEDAIDYEEGVGNRSPFADPGESSQPNSQRTDQDTSSNSGSPNH